MWLFLIFIGAGTVGVFAWRPFAGLIFGVVGFVLFWGSTTAIWRAHNDLIIAMTVAQMAVPIMGAALLILVHRFLPKVVRIMGFLLVGALWFLAHQWVLENVFEGHWEFMAANVDDTDERVLGYFLGPILLIISLAPMAITFWASVSDD